MKLEVWHCPGRVGEENRSSFVEINTRKSPSLVKNNKTGFPTRSAGTENTEKEIRREEGKREGEREKKGRKRL